MAMIGWLVVFVALVGIEVGTMALTTIWFAGGALAAFFMALAGLSFQAVKYVNKGTVKTNVDGLVGKKARVLEEIDNGSGAGTAVLNGQEWTARAVRDDLVIHKGETVIVKEIRGVKLMVDRISEGE